VFSVECGVGISTEFSCGQVTLEHHFDFFKFGLSLKVHFNRFSQVSVV
jgi:hypothetical protein